MHIYKHTRKYIYIRKNNNFLSDKLNIFKNGCFKSVENFTRYQSNSKYK